MPHPFAPAQADEIELAAKLLSKCHDSPLAFKSAGLRDPPKEAMKAFLDEGAPAPPREMFMVYYVQGEIDCHEAVVNVTEGKISSRRTLPAKVHGGILRSEKVSAIDVALKHAAIKAELERLQLPKDLDVVVDAWGYGRDNAEEDRRLAQLFFYTRNPKNNHPESNYYAFPLDFMAVVDLVKLELVSVARIPTGADAFIDQETKGRLLGDPEEPEYTHSLQSKPTRTSMKPLHVVQPEGASFKLEGYKVEWEKWSFHVGWNYREGMMLYDVCFDGRRIFYRLSLSEMFVPYGDPRDPLHRKAAFDLGNAGAGNTANDLSLGCDCLGVIAYLDGFIIDASGSATAKKNCICIHEVDAGVQWKHTNPLTGKATVVRKRQLQLQTIITVSNYEYIFYWIFDQAGEIEFEARATGILSTTPVDPANKDKIPFATRVGDGVLAPYHQHIFNLRIDPAIDGWSNSVSYVDSVAMDPDDPLNVHKIGYVTKETQIEKASTFETNPGAARAIKIFNPSKINPVSHQPIAYKVVPINSQRMLADEDSWHFRRADFGTHPLWVTKYRDHELFPAGDYTNSSMGGTGIRNWVYPARDESVVDEDIVLWHTFTFTHNPRPEDFPIMPAESARVALKPVGFFTYNPSMDVPPSSQAFNKSVLHSSSVTNGCVANTESSLPVTKGSCCGP